jgi:hypothetical protein
MEDHVKNHVCTTDISRCRECRRRVCGECRYRHRGNSSNFLEELGTFGPQLAGREDQFDYCEVCEKLSMLYFEEQRLKKECEEKKDNLRREYERLRLNRLNTPN